MANLDTLSINSNQICIESKQKKQEFGGAKVSIKNLNCDKFINASDQNSIINDYEFFDAAISYRKDKDSKWEFELRATNLLDTKSQSQSNVSNISVSTSEYFIQPRFITLRLIYSL